MLDGQPFGYFGDYILWWVLYLSLVVHAWCFFRFFPRAKHRRFGLVVGNALVTACLLGAVALAGESYYRFVCVEIDSFGMSLPARRWFALYARLNSLGCRDKEWSREKPPDVRRIAFVGDSFTYGWGIEQVEDRFTDRIQVSFNSRSGDRVEVMNVAKPGWDTQQELQPVADMIDAYGVDEIVLCYVPNDIEGLIPTSPDFDPTTPPDPTWFNPDASYLLTQMYQRLWLPRLPTVRGYHDWLAEGVGEPTIWRRHERQLGAMVARCRDRGVLFRVVLLPFVRDGGERFDRQAVFARLTSFFEAEGVEVVDGSRALAGRSPDDLVVNAQDSHPNELAHRLFAEAIWTAFYADSTE